VNPQPADPKGNAKEAGWHLEGSFSGPDGSMRVNLGSRGRALLMLFLLSDVGEDDAPTRVRVGSHLDVPPLLEPYGEVGREWMELCMVAVPASQHRPVELVTGTVGDVYLCHPFLVHSAQRHCGRTRVSWLSHRCCRPKISTSTPATQPRSRRPCLTDSACTFPTAHRSGDQP
jgi:hypothetical protein